MDLEACLPAHLRGPATAITRIAAGLSGAGVYRVEAAGQTWVLKVAARDQAVTEWRSKLHILQLVADAGLAPTVVHVDEAQRSVLSAFVADRSFPAFFGDPRTRDSAIALLGATIRRVHDLPAPSDAVATDPRAFIAATWSQLTENFAVPGFVADAVLRVLSEPAPDRERSLVLSHNDVNPTNLVYDGEQLRLLDWDAAGLNDHFYDLAAISVFLRMDDATCQRLLGAYDGAQIAELPMQFAYNRRLLAVQCGVTLLQVARRNGHDGGDETLAAAPLLGEFYQRLQSGALNLASAEGQWLFGLAMVKTSTTL